MNFTETVELDIQVPSAFSQIRLHAENSFEQFGRLARQTSRSALLVVALMPMILTGCSAAPSPSLPPPIANDSLVLDHLTLQQNAASLAGGDLEALKMHFKGHQLKPYGDIGDAEIVRPGDIVKITTDYRSYDPLAFPTVRCIFAVGEGEVITASPKTSSIFAQPDGDQTFGLNVDCEIPEIAQDDPQDALQLSLGLSVSNDNKEGREQPVSLASNQYLYYTSSTEAEKNFPILKPSDYNAKIAGEIKTFLPSNTDVIIVVGDDDKQSPNYLEPYFRQTAEDALKLLLDQGWSREQIKIVSASEDDPKFLTNQSVESVDYRNASSKEVYQAIVAQQILAPKNRNLLIYLLAHGDTDGFLQNKTGLNADSISPGPMQQILNIQRQHIFAIIGTCYSNVLAKSISMNPNVIGTLSMSADSEKAWVRNGTEGIDSMLLAYLRAGFDPNLALQQATWRLDNSVTLPKDEARPNPMLWFRDGKHGWNTNQNIFYDYFDQVFGALVGRKNIVN